MTLSKIWQVTGAARSQRGHIEQIISLLFAQKPEEATIEGVLRAKFPDHWEVLTYKGFLGSRTFVTSIAEVDLYDI